MAPSLQTLPCKLLELIGTSCKASEDLEGLRLTCRNVQAATRRAWFSAHFSLRNIAWDIALLSRLLDVSKVADLAAAVTDSNVFCEDDNTLALPTTPSGSDILQCCPLLVLIFQGLTNVNRFGFVYVSQEGPGSHETITFSTTFSAVMFAVQSCGLRPKDIRAYPFKEGHTDADVGPSEFRKPATHARLSLRT